MKKYPSKHIYTKPTQPLVAEIHITVYGFIQYSSPIGKQFYIIH